MNRTTFALLEEYMLACMKDSAHDREHVYRVLNNALAIAQGEQDVNWDVLIASALLHDISRPEQLADPRVDHASHGADKAYAFLQENGFDQTFCAHVRGCIRTHRFRKIDPPSTLEARILFDAAKLDVAGAIGIARTLEYNGETGRPLYTRNENGVISDGTGDRADSFFKEYKFKLEGIYDHFLTRRGAELARQRQRAAQDFYAALLAEVRDEKGSGCLDDLLTDA